MLGQPKVVVVTVELRVVSGASDELIHGLQFQVTVLEEIIASYGRHIEETIRVHTVAVKEVVTCGNLYAGPRNNRLGRSRPRNRKSCLSFAGR